MKISEPQLTVAKSSQGLGYTQGNGVDNSAIAQGLGALASGAGRVADSYARVALEQRQKEEQMRRFKATTSLVDYNTQVELEQNEFLKNAAPDDPAVAMKAVDVYVDREAEFLKTLPEDMQEEFKMRVADTRARVTLNAYNHQDKQLATYYTNEVLRRGETAAAKLSEDPELVETWRADLTQMIANSDMPAASKLELKQKVDEFIETAAYRAKSRDFRLQDAQYSDELVTATRQAAQELGVDPIDLLTVISYETGGTFSTGIRGGAGNRHIGLIQFGEEEQKQFGARQGQPVGEQMAAVVRFLKARGFKPGMSTAQLYATINAGSPEKLNASDAKNGGMPGTVLDKVNSPQWAEHRAKALQLADGKYVIPDDLDNDPRFANVPYEARIAARNDSNTEVNQLMAQMREERKAQADAARNELLKQLEFGPLENASKLIDEAMAKGQLGDYDDLHKAVEIVKKREKELEEYSSFVKNFQLGVPLDHTNPDNKKGMDKRFKDSGGENALYNKDKEYVDRVLIEDFNRHQMIPPSALGVLTAMSQSFNGQDLMFAFQSLDRLEETNPLAYAAQVPKELRERVDRFQTLNNKYDPNELIDVLRGPRTQEQRNAVEYRRKEIAKILTMPNSPVSFDSVSEIFDGAAIPAGIAGDAMRTDWQAILTEKYANGLVLTPEEAQAETNKEFQRLYGVTSINGGTIMRNPPDKLTSIYPRFNEWGEAQIRGELGLRPDQQIQLISDDQTDAELNRGMKPTYQVVVFTNGLPQLLYSDPVPAREPSDRAAPGPGRTEPLRYYFELTKEHVEAQQAEDVLKNKEARLAKLRELTMPYPFGRAGFDGPVPQTLLDERKALEEELNVVKTEVEAKKSAANTQYETPLMKQYNDLDRQIQPILDELTAWTGLSEDFPKLAELERLMAEQEKLKPGVDAEIAARRNGAR